MILILFDIDGTLISTDGAGMRAFRRAMHEVCGIVPEPGVVRPDGKTDPLILKELLRHYGFSGPDGDSLREAVFGRYLEYLGTEMSRARESGQIRTLPGVEELLETLESEPDFAGGLATGNISEGAGIKLAAAGLHRFFHFGGFGSDSEDRTLLIRIGIERGIQHVSPARVDSFFVVGDTPLDVEHGRAAGAGVIAVASGRYSAGNLRACNPDLLLPDLTPAGTVLSFLRKNGKKCGK